jgi:hypothetical protein
MRAVLGRIPLCFDGIASEGEMNNLQALTIIWNALHDYRENSISEGEQANDDAWDEITHAMAVIHESLDINHEEID